MRYFDLHCDTATCLFDSGETFENTDCAVNARSAKTFEKYGIYEYITKYFESLHTMGDHCIVQDVKA